MLVNDDYTSLYLLSRNLLGLVETDGERRANGTAECGSMAHRAIAAFNVQCTDVCFIDSSVSALMCIVQCTARVILVAALLMSSQRPSRDCQ